MRFKDLSQSAKKAHVEASFHDAIQNLDRLHPDANGLHGHERLAGWLNMQCAGLRYDLGQMAQAWAAEHGHHTPEAVARFVAEAMSPVPVPSVVGRPH